MENIFCAFALIHANLSICNPIFDGTFHKQANRVKGNRQPLADNDG
jgi:hypothetical protein